MFWKVERIKDKNYITVILEGEFNVDDHLQMIESILLLEDWRPGINLLLDSRKLNLINSDVDVLREAGNNMAKFNQQIGDGKAAILMATVAGFGKGRQFEMVTEAKVSANIRIFLEEQLALDWLADC